MTVNGLPVKNCLTLTKSVAVTTMLKKTFFFFLVLDIARNTNKPSSAKRCLVDSCDA